MQRSKSSGVTMVLFTGGPEALRGAPIFLEGHSTVKFGVLCVFTADVIFKSNLKVKL